VQCVVVCCSVVQWFAVCCSVWQADWYLSGVPTYSLALSRSLSLSLSRTVSPPPASLSPSLPLLPVPLPSLWCASILSHTIGKKFHDDLLMSLLSRATGGRESARGGDLTIADATATLRKLVCARSVVQCGAVWCSAVLVCCSMLQCHELMNSCQRHCHSSETGVCMHVRVSVGAYQCVAYDLSRCR